MAQVLRLTAEQAYDEMPVFARIDLRKYDNEIKPFLKEKSLQPKKKTYTKYLTHEQFVAQCNMEIDNLCKEYVTK
jgi:hypothetical protein